MAKKPGPIFDHVLPFSEMSSARGRELKESSYKRYVAGGFHFISGLFQRKIGGVDIAHYLDSAEIPPELPGGTTPLQSMLFQTFTHVKGAMSEASRDKNSATWRNLRRHVAYLYSAAGLEPLAAQIDSYENGTPLEHRKGKVGRKSRMLSATDEEIQAMDYNLAAWASDEVQHMATLCKYLGIRPSSAPDVELIYKDTETGSLRIFIPAKKRTARAEAGSPGQRGIDVEVSIKIHPGLEAAIEFWGTAYGESAEKDMTDVKRASRGFKSLAQKVFGGHRSKTFCLYTYRYTMGSNLKARLRNRKDGFVKMSAILGHKCTSSISSYGNVLSASDSFSLSDLPVPTKSCMNQVKVDRQMHLSPHETLPDRSVSRRNSSRQPSRRDTQRRAQHQQSSQPSP